ncbi:peptidyl-prolyl cis-trans isomerase SurA [Kushneria sinocarnis]|uniref:Peptidyl-prolyl cis-trans isomerase SurA n=1 Tax=Kushneria sinocarnis TaxID=595502 RepID=A0A420WZ88_9GAMM|nr:peptidylprolyl isomerase [Kushneria sinocarnis]RKR06597.1 peptidyl-prolyl cis-trans isomerase SurA [Kushneria sinocarnis]
MKAGNLRNPRLAPLLALVMALVLAPLAHAEVQPLSQIVAVVNDDAIMSTELDDRVRQVRSQLQSRDVPLPDESELRRQVLQRMITEQIELQMAERANLSVGDTQLNRALRSIAQNNDMTLDQFSQQLQQQELSLGDVREQVRRELLINQVQQHEVAGQVNISDREVDQYLQNAGANANVQYHLGHILIAVPEAPTPQQAQAAQQKARQLRERIASGDADFQQVAASQSDGSHALDGGDLGWRSGAELPTVFSDVVPEMSVGDISQPIRSPSGYHLVRLIDQRGGGSADQQREQVRRRLFERKVNDRLEAWTQEIRASAYIDNRLENSDSSGGSAQ